MGNTSRLPGGLRPAFLLCIPLALGGVSATARDARAQAPPPAVTLRPVRPGQAPPNPYSKDLVARGKLLVLSGGCNDCHTPWRFDPGLASLAPDWSRMLSGHPEGAPDPQGELGPDDVGLVGPTSTSFKLRFGTTYAPNLTPDIDTGTGSWTETMFLDVFRKGRHLGGDGRPVYPPMPWEWIRYCSDEDLKAIFAYLRSIPPLRNLPPTEKVAPSAADTFIAVNDRIIARQKNPNAKLAAPKDAPPPPPALALRPVVRGKAPKRTYPADRVRKGKTLVMFGHCNNCHTPRTYDPVLGVTAPDMTRMLSGHPEGAPDPQGRLGPEDVLLVGPTLTSFRLGFGVTYSKNLTPDLGTGIGDWTEQQFLEVFRKARHVTGRTILPPMPWDMIRNLPDADLLAIFAYLQSVPPLRNPVPASKVPPPMLEKLGQLNDRIAREPTGPR
jgi:mono/diheme cytochrome c family protein